MSKTISVSLSEKSFRDASKGILKYKQEVIAKCRTFAERLAERGVEIAQMKIQSHNAVYTGELWASIQKTPGMVLQYGSTYIVYTDCPWAKYVEFGTGITGSHNPHPNALYPVGNMMLMSMGNPAGFTTKTESGTGQKECRPDRSCTRPIWN